jgi:type IV secretion system protein TrbB
MQQARDERKARLVEMVRRYAGPDIANRFDDDDVTDILVNEDCSVLEDRLSTGKRIFTTIDRDRVEAMINVIADMAGEIVNADNPILECELFNGARFEAVVPPVVSSPIFALRTHSARRRTLDDYVNDGIMTTKQRDYLGGATHERWNIVASGATKAGKTTLLNALAEEVSVVWPADRILVMQQVNELRFAVEDVVYLRVAKNVDFQALLRATLRLRPDRIVVGEVRGGEALDMLKAWNTGHDGGLATLHANSTQAALSRLEDLVLEVSNSPMERTISEAVNVVVQIVRDGTSRRISEISRVLGYDHKSRKYIVENVGV